MKEQIVSLIAIGKRVAALLVLVTGLLFLVSQPEVAGAVDDCFGACDSTYSQCSSCCVGQPPGQCYSCPNSCSGYASCAIGCFGSNTWSGSCRNQQQCSNLYGRFYAQCMTGELGECLNGDGTVNGSCCYNQAVQEYSGCCYP